jgi:predicted acylesterase/phospholipase RssA
VFRKRVDTLQFFDVPYMWRRPLKAWAQYFADVAFVTPELARRTWKAAVNRNLSSWLNLALWHDTSPMLRLMTESISLETIRDGEGLGRRPERLLRVVATERGAGQARVFKNSDFSDDVGHRIVLASCALPIIFPPVRVNGSEYVYGGLVMQTPLEPAVAAGCTVIHLIHNEPRTQKMLDGEEPSTREMLNRTVAVALLATLERDLDNRRRTNQLLDAFARAGTEPGKFLPAGEGYRRVVVHQYRPARPLGGMTRLLDFSRKNIEEAIATGERDAARHDCAESGCIL